MTYTEKYGQPQGNELVYGKDIIRRTDTFEFILIDQFKSSKEAQAAYDDWMDEYAEWDFADGEKVWNYARSILGVDENGQPIIHDSWGEKK